MKAREYYDWMKKSLNQHLIKLTRNVYIIPSDSPNVIENPIIIVFLELITNDGDVKSDNRHPVSIFHKRVKEILARYSHYLIASQTSASLLQIYMFIFSVPSNSLTMALIAKDLSQKKTTFIKRFIILSKLTRKFKKKLKICLQNPKKPSYWEKLLDDTDEWLEIFKKIQRFQQQSLEYLKQQYGPSRERQIKLFIKSLIIQLLITWYLQKLGFLDKNPWYLLTKFRQQRQDSAKKDTYHEFLFQQFKRLNANFDGHLTFEKKLFTLMKCYILPDSFYLTDENNSFSSFVKAKKQSRSRQPQQSESVGGILNILDEIAGVNADFLDTYFIGAIFEHVNHQHDRKKTGSYYTPKYVAEFIVDKILNKYVVNSVNNIFNTKFSHLNEIIHQADEKILQFSIKKIEIIKMLDPAVGTGHFLDAACDILLKYHLNIHSRLKECNDTCHPPSKESKILKKSNPHSRMDFSINAVTVSEKTPDIILRHIYQNNIYGVDINEDAISLTRIRLIIKLLSKISSKNNDFSSSMRNNLIKNVHFNLHVGNALIGLLSLDDIPDTPNHVTEDPTILQLLKKLELIITRILSSKKGSSASSSNQQEEKKQSNSTSPNTVKRWMTSGMIALLLLQKHETNTITNGDTIKDHTKHETVTHEYLKSQLTRYLRTLSTRLLEKKVNINKNLKDLRPFHWMIEFPESFFLQKETKTKNDHGFDIIIGNPPYIRQEEINTIYDGFSQYKNILTTLYTPSDPKYDYSMYFILRSLQLLKNDGWNSFIITDKWLRTIYGKKIRMYLKSHHSLVEFLDLSELNMFNAARVKCIIYLLKKTRPSSHHVTKYERYEDPLLLNPTNKITVKQDDLPQEKPWVFIPKKWKEMIEWMETYCLPLRKLQVKIFYGIKTGLNQAFLINETTRKKLASLNVKNAELLKPITMGRDIDRYQIKWKHKWIIFSKNGLNLQSLYPDLFNHLKRFEERLKRRVDQGKYWYNLRPCRYYDEFEKPKIIWKEIVTRPSFYYDTCGRLVDATAFIMTGKDVTKTLTAILNSQISWFNIQVQATNLSPTTLRYKREYTFNLPIRLPPREDENAFNVLVDAIQFLQSTSSLKRQASRDYVKFLEELLDTMIFELYFEEKLQNQPFHHLSTLREIIRNHLQEIHLPFNQWDKLTWEHLTEPEKQSSDSHLNLKLLENQMWKQIQKMCRLLQQDKNIQAVTKTTRQLEWYQLLKTRSPSLG